MAENATNYRLPCLLGGIQPATEVDGDAGWRRYSRPMMKKNLRLQA